MFNSDNDSRVTPIGHFLRKTSLVEVPQFLNLLTGNMCFIDPKPKLYEGKGVYNNFSDDYKKTLS